MDIIFKGRHTDVPDRFRRHAAAKLAKIEKLDHKAIRVDVEVTAEHNPRQSQRRERVELTISSRGPAIRAEAAAEDRYIALDAAFAKLESRLRRACDRRKSRHGGHAAIRVADLPAAGSAGAEGRDFAAEPTSAAVLPAGEGAAVPDAAAGSLPDSAGAAALDAAAGDSAAADSAAAGGGTVPVPMEGEGPLIVREKFHGATPMAIDQALFEMELVGHDFFLYRDIENGCPSVVYRRRGYQYGVIRLIDADDRADGQAGQPAATVASRYGSRLGQRSGHLG